MNTGVNNEEEKYSEDHEEQMRIENDILKLKLQAELGGSFEGEHDIDPDVENAFLKNIFEFEHQFANAASKTVFEILENPDTRNEAFLNDAEIDDTLVFLEELMEQKGIVVDYAEDYDKRIKYKFITEELFNHEATFINIPGMTTHYGYEEFHPNHRLDIKRNAEDFFQHWTERSFDENSHELASECLLENGTILPREVVMQKIKLIFDSYVGFENASFSIDNISFEMHEAGEGLGVAEGFTAFDARLENGEILHFEAPFKLYMQYDNWWNIFFFHWPGFNW